MAVDSSGRPGSWPKPLSANFLHLRRTGLPGRRTGQEGWPGQMALVSSCRRPPHRAMPPGSLHATRHLGLVSRDAGADRWAPSHGNRWLPPPCPWSGDCRGTRTSAREDPGRQGGAGAGTFTWTRSGMCAHVQLLRVGLGGVSSSRVPREHAAAGRPRPRGRAPLGSTWQVGLAWTEVPDLPKETWGA